MSATTKRRWPKNALRVVLGVVAGLAATELAFWHRDAGAFAHVNCYVADPALGVRLRPGATETIRFGSEKNPVTSVRINAEGFRGDAWPPPSADEIVIVGDSQTFGLGVEEGETFAKVLQGALGDRRFVRNLGVPTYGPREYNAILAEQLDRRPAKTVIWVANVANDLFEASHPNTTRHAVWDGWAVRRESAPAHVTSFPGRSLLYTHSHAFLALRRWLYERGPQDSEAGSPTEGTWRDIGRASDEALEDHALAEHERARLAALHAVELEIAKDRAAAQTREVDQLVLRKTPYEELADHGDREDPRWISQEQTYLASRLSPGDIVTAVNGEVERESGSTPRRSAAASSSETASKSASSRRPGGSTTRRSSRRSTSATRETPRWRRSRRGRSRSGSSSRRSRRP